MGRNPEPERPDVLTVDSFDRPILDLLPAAKAGDTGQLQPGCSNPLGASPGRLIGELSVAGVHRDGLTKSATSWHVNMLPEMRGG